jgi:hypothetical protein
VEGKMTAMLLGVKVLISVLLILWGTPYFSRQMCSGNDKFAVNQKNNL